VNTHVTWSLLSRLPVPLITADREEFDYLRELTQSLMRAADAESTPEYAELQALVAHLYGLSDHEFEHVLGTFPLIPEAVRQAAYQRFTLATYEDRRR
jgi:hypothetical protein